jgi:hypothetical protein
MMKGAPCRCERLAIRRTDCNVTLSSGNDEGEPCAREATGALVGDSTACAFVLHKYLDIGLVALMRAEGSIWRRRNP